MKKTINYHLMGD